MHMLKPLRLLDFAGYGSAAPAEVLDGLKAAVVVGR